MLNLHKCEFYIISNNVKHVEWINSKLLKDHVFTANNAISRDNNAF